MRRCKYSQYWYYPVLVMIKNYHKLDKDKNATLCLEFKKAIDETIQEFEQTEEGRQAVQAVRLMDIEDTHTLTGAVNEIHQSRSTIKRRRKAFIYAVGEKMHFR